MKHPVLESIKTRTATILNSRKLALSGVFAILALVIACYPEPQVSYSNPQESGAYQWLIEYKTGEERVHLEMRYRRVRENGSGYSNTGFMITPDQLTGLTREQAMSSGTNVKFQLKRDAGTFNFEGWFKEGNGSGHSHSARILLLPRS